MNPGRLSSLLNPSLKATSSKPVSALAATENGAALPLDAGVALIGLRQDGARHRVEIQLG